MGKLIGGRLKPPPMHIASKITLILGALLFIGSGIGLAFGVGSVADSGVETQTYFESEDGSFTIAAEPTYNLDYWDHFSVRDFTRSRLITTWNSPSPTIRATLCSLRHGLNAILCSNITMGIVNFFSYLVASDTDESYTVDSNVEVVVEGDYCDSECIEAVVGGIFGAIGGGFGICCSIPLLILGIILAFVLDDPPQAIAMPVGQMPMGQTVYQPPVGQPVQQGYVGQPMHQGAGRSSNPTFRSPRDPDHTSVDATACSTCSEPLGQRSAASMRLRRSLLGQSRVRRTQAESRQSCSILGKDRHRCTRDLSILLLHMWSLNR